MTQAVATAKKPAPKLLTGVLPEKKAARNAIRAIIHQGNINPAIKHRMNMMRKSIATAPLNLAR